MTDIFVLAALCILLLVSIYGYIASVRRSGRLFARHATVAGNGAGQRAMPVAQRPV